MTKEAKQALKLRFDYNNMMIDTIGEKEGIRERKIDAILQQIHDAKKYVDDNKGKGMLGWMDSPDMSQEIVKDIISTAKHVRKNFSYFVVLGIGGSALGPISVFQALCHLHYNDLPKAKRKGPIFYVEDNVDPERMLALLDVIEPEKTMFNVITKSGATSETMTQYLVITDILKKALGDKFANNVIATTDEKKGNLIKLAKREGFKTFFIPDGVGGRFSELSPVGLLPASVLGIDIKALLDGAKFMQKQIKSANPYKNAPLMAASLQYLSMKNGKNISVMMPYADSLKYISDWYCQLWGESLGKEKNYNGELVNAGQTPVKALGVTDQHSQIQLYTEGPFDKVVTFIAVDKFRGDVTIPYDLEDMPDVNFLCGHTMSELINSERKATEFALTIAKRANNTIYVPEVNAFTLGELLMFFMLETAYCGALLNVNTFNQPGVEQGKKATFAMMGRKGYEEQAKELDNVVSNNKYII